MSIIEYCTWKYKKSIKSVEDAPQGSNVEAIEKAQKKMDEVSKALDEVIAGIAKLTAEKEELAKAKAELEAAVAALKAEEDAYQAKIAALEGTIAKETGMKQAKAKNELAQLKAEDPLPLRRAKITQEAALRKVQKQEKAVDAALADLTAKQSALEKSLDEVRAELQRAKAAGGGGKGALWFIERRMYEADAYLPTAKQKYNHKQPFSYDP